MLAEWAIYVERRPIYRSNIRQHISLIYDFDIDRYGKEKLCCQYD